MTRTQALANALTEINNYYTSRSHDEHLAKQRDEVRRGIRKREKEPTQTDR